MSQEEKSPGSQDLASIKTSGLNQSNDSIVPSVLESASASSLDKQIVLGGSHKPAPYLSEAPHRRTSFEFFRRTSVQRHKCFFLSLFFAVRSSGFVSMPLTLPAATSLQQKTEQIGRESREPAFQSKSGTTYRPSSANDDDKPFTNSTYQTANTEDRRQ